MPREIRIIRSQPPCEKLGKYVEIISLLIRRYYAEKHEEETQNTKNETGNNKDDTSQLMEVILDVTSEIKKRLDFSLQENYTRYSARSKEIVHVAIRSWLDANDNNRKLFMRIINNRYLSHSELSDIIMQSICRYCVNRFRKLSISNPIVKNMFTKAQQGEVEVIDMKRVFKNERGLSHLKLLLASLMEVRGILNGSSGYSAKLVHSYIEREVEKNILPTIKVGEDLELTIEEVTEHALHEYGTADQYIVEEEKDIRYQIPHFIQYHKTSSIKAKVFSSRVIKADTMMKIRKKLMELTNDKDKKYFEESVIKISEFAKISRGNIEALFKQLKDNAHGIYRKIGELIKELSDDFIALWDRTNSDINNAANRLKEPLINMIKVLKSNQLEKYPVMDVSSDELIDTLHYLKSDVLSKVIKYAGGKMSEDFLRNTILYFTLKYSRDLYRDLIQLFRTKREEMYFAKTNRNIYGYDELTALPQENEVIEDENEEVRKSLNADRIAEIIASILIYYVLIHYLKHYERDGLHGNVNEIRITDYLRFMLINLESFQASLYDIFYSTILQFATKFGSLSFLLHNYIRLDNMMYLASIVANSWPLFAPFFSTSSANVWTIYREIENETFAQHDVGPGIITDDIISMYENNPEEKPFAIFTQIQSFWPWNRKSKGIRQISREELLKLEEQYRQWQAKQKETEDRKTEEKFLPTRTTLEEIKNDPVTQKLSNELQEEISILQSIVNGYNAVMDLRLLRLHIFYQMNLIYENYKNLKQTIKEHLQKGTPKYEMKEEDKVVETELRNPIFVKNMEENSMFSNDTRNQTNKSDNDTNFDISYVNYAIDIYAPINTIVTRLFFICGLSMQSETGYYSIDEGIVEREEPKRNFTNWSKSLLFNDADYLIVAYSLNKGLGTASNKFAKKMFPGSKLVFWVRDKLDKETKRLQPIVNKIIEVYEKIKRSMDDEEESEEK
jgi:hypothetical protein